MTRTLFLSLFSAVLDRVVTIDNDAPTFDHSQPLPDHLLPALVECRATDRYFADRLRCSITEPFEALWRDTVKVVAGPVDGADIWRFDIHGIARSADPSLWEDWTDYIFLNCEHLHAAFDYIFGK